MRLWLLWRKEDVFAAYLFLYEIIPDGKVELRYFVGELN